MQRAFLPSILLSKLPICPRPPTAPSSPACALQATVEQIESSVAKLQEKLAKEREKHAKYDAVLKEHEQRWVGGGRVLIWDGRGRGKGVQRTAGGRPRPGWTRWHSVDAAPPPQASKFPGLWRSCW